MFLKRVLPLVLVLVLAVTFLPGCAGEEEGPTGPSVTLQLSHQWSEGDVRDRLAHELADNGLKVGTLRRMYRDDVDVGEVAATTPAPGMRVREGREIAMVISRGSAEVKVPLVVGLQVNEAEKVLGKKGLSMRKAGERRSHAPVGEVVSQSPAPGRMTGRGSTVAVMLSGGEDYGLVRVEDADGEKQTVLFRELEIIVPEGERIQRVTVLAGYGDDMEAVYDRPHRPGDRVKVQLWGKKGKRVEVQIEGETIYKTQL